MTTVSDLNDALDRIAPFALAEPWDNVGLIVGQAAKAIDGPIVLTIDLTPAVLAECLALRAKAVVVYHPPIFEAIKRLTSADSRQGMILQAIEAGMSIHSPHTALDNAPGCMSDWLADCILEPGKPRSADRRALIPKAVPTPSQQCKIVTFVPESAVEQVRGALASAGAGLIGAYSACSFTSPGVGTFLGSPDSNPAVGKPGQLERIPELRLEMVISRRSVPLALELLKRFHPYQEPAVDVYPLEPKPERSTGAGRRLLLDTPVKLDVIVERVKKNLNISHVQIAPAPISLTPGKEQDRVERVGLCPGAGAALVDAAASEGCQLYLTGEMKHHEVLAANAKGVSILLAGHSNTERGYLPLLRERLIAALPGADVRVSTADRQLMRTV